MIWDPSLFHYACIAKDTTVLAEYNPKDAELGAIAAKCLEKTPPFHSTFTHTIRSKTYMFLIDEFFVYFLISDEKLERSEGLGFLKSLRDAFVVEFHGESRLEENLSSHCFQGEFSPVFRRLLAPEMYVVDGIGSPSGHRGKKMNMKSRFTRNKEKEVDGNGLGLGFGFGFSNDFSPILNKNRGFYSTDAKKVWKKQVWIVLLLDLMACVVLFSVWLWVCRGLKCMER